MKVYWLSALPLASAVVVASIRRWRVPMVILGLITILTGLALLFSLPLDEATAFLEQQWLLDSTGRALLAYAYVGTAILLAIAATTEEAGTVYAPVLASVGLLSAVVLLRALLLPLLILPAALAVTVLATAPKSPAVAPRVLMATRGAAPFLAWATLPIPFLLAAFWLLDQVAVHPQELARLSWSPWLVLPAAILWLTLFPFNGTMPLWAEGGPPFAPAFLWTVKDGVVIYLLLSLWQQVPLLHSARVLSALGTFGLLTAILSGIWAAIQSNPSAVLACAAMSVQGLIVQGMALDSREGLQVAVFLLLSRSAAVLLACSALAPLYNLSDGAPEPGAKRLPWQGLALMLLFIVGVLALAALPVLDCEYILTVLQVQDPRLLQAWRISLAGIFIGLARTSWGLWRENVRASAGRVRIVPFLIAVCLFLLPAGACLYLSRV